MCDSGTLGTLLNDAGVLTARDACCVCGGGANVTRQPNTMTTARCVLRGFSVGPFIIFLLF